MEVILKHQYSDRISHEYFDSNFIESFPDSSIDIFNDTTIPSTLYYEQPALRPYSSWKLKHTHVDEQTFVKNYVNPLFSVTNTTLTIVLEKNEEKVSLKIFESSRHRTQGISYFTKTTSLKYLTYNKISKCLYSGGMINYHKKRKYSSRIRKNNFHSTPISKFILTMRAKLSSCFQTKYMESYMQNNMIDDYIYNFLKEIGIDTNELIKSTTHGYNGDVILFRKNLENKGIKCSDNFSVFINQFPLPNKKEAKDANYKLINLIMNREKLTNRKFKKILHQVKYFKNESWNHAKNAFGEDVIKNLPEDFIKKIFESKVEIGLYNCQDLLSIEDRKNALSIFELIFDEVIGVHTFNDHVRMYKKLNKFEKTKWQSYDAETFKYEHQEYSEKYQHYSTGSYIRTYNEKFMNMIKNPIHCDSKIYSPVLLLDTNSYTNESTIQSNCVRTYITRPDSVIISLRCEEERATIDYQIRVGENVLLTRNQTLGRFNNSLSEKWNEPLLMLDERIQKFMKNNEFELPELTVHYGNKFSKSTKAVKITQDNINTVRWEDNFLVEEVSNFIYAPFIPMLITPHRNPVIPQLDIF